MSRNASALVALALSAIAPLVALASGINGTFPEVPNGLSCLVSDANDSYTVRIHGLNSSEGFAEVHFSADEVVSAEVKVEGDRFVLDLAGIGDQYDFFELSYDALKRHQGDETSSVGGKRVVGYDWIDGKHVTETPIDCTKLD